MYSRFRATLVFLLSLPLIILGQNGTIEGRVTDAEGNGLPGANITIEALALGSAADMNGDFTIDGVSDGTHAVRAQFIGYISVTRSVTVSDGQMASVNFQLEGTSLSMANILVTGSRSAGRTAMKSPTPIDGFDDITLRRQGNGDLTETLKALVPSFHATPLTGDGAAFVRPTSLRGLPPDDILVLTNSKRRHRSALIAHFGAAMNVGAHAVDVGQIPSIAIKRLEVLRDGASAQYGSDAIAGVMNFILKDNSEGIEIQTTTGRWMGAPNGRGGETDLTVAANIGLPLTDNGFLNVSLEYSDRPELSRGLQDKDASDGYKGWITEYGLAENTVSTNTDKWKPAMNWGRPASSGFRSVWNAGLWVSDKVEAYSFGNFADTYGNYSFFYRDTSRADALQPMPINPLDPSEGDFNWQDTFTRGFTPRLEGFGTDFSSVVGIRGELNVMNGLNYDFSASYGSNLIHYILNESLNASWGPNSPFSFEIGDLKQSETNYNADFSYPVSEAINLAFGLEWREEAYQMFEGDKYSYTAGPWALVHTLTDTAGVNYGYVPPGGAANGMRGTSRDEAGIFARQNYAAYVDVEFDVTDDLLVQAAGRFEDFSDFGTTTNGKFAARYTLMNFLTLRGSGSTGFRGPTPGQANVTTVTTSFDGVTGEQVLEGTLRPTDPIVVDGFGGKALVPEKAVNISVGFTANLLGNLNLTVDYYQIAVDSRIIKSRSLALPAGISDEFTEVAFYTNSLDTKTNGLDVVAVYRLDWANGTSSTVSLAFNNNTTEVVTQREVGGQLPVSQGTIDNIENNLPKQRASITAVHGFSQKLALMARANYYSGTLDERGSKGDDKEEVDPIALIDVELSYHVSNSLSLVLGINNALNTYPTEIGTRASQGMPYPRRSPISYHGGVTYLRVMYNF